MNTKEGEGDNMREWERDDRGEEGENTREEGENRRQGEGDNTREDGEEGDFMGTREEERDGEDEENMLQVTEVLATKPIQPESKFIVVVVL